MIMWSDLPAEALEDCFRPPNEPCEVWCVHCGQRYSSSQIVWRRHPDGQGFWCCPMPGCDGVGFRFDILPVGGYVDDDGQWVESGWVDDDEDDEDGEDGGEECEYDEEVG